MNLFKAFDCLPHSLIFSKLYTYGASESACKLIARVGVGGWVVVEGGEGGDGGAVGVGRGRWGCWVCMLGKLASGI